MRTNVMQFPRPYALNPYAGMPRFTHPHAISPMAGYGQPVAPTGEEFEGWVAQVFMTDAAFTDEEIDAAMDQAWADAIERGAVSETYYFAGVESYQDKSTGLYGVMVYYYVPPDLADPARVPGAKKGWPWYAYLGIGLGAVAVIGTVVLIATSKRRRRRKK
jgi:hypothetical protein